MGGLGHTKEGKLKNDKGLKILQKRNYLAPQQRRQFGEWNSLLNSVSNK